MYNESVGKAAKKYNTDHTEIQISMNLKEDVEGI